MKVVVLGAGGKLGRRLVESALARGHEVTAAARNPGLAASAWAQASPRPRFLPLDAMEPASLDAALAGHDAMVSAAGNVADGQRFIDLFDRVVSSAERVLGGERRVWMLAGALALDIPKAGRIGLGLPFVPKHYRPHLQNWRRLERSRLDWALMCPGQLSLGDDRPIAGRVRVSTDALPVDVAAWTRFAPPIALSVLLKSKLPCIAVTYRGIADVIMDHLEPGGRFSRKRVGVGWRAPDDKPTSRDPA